MSSAVLDMRAPVDQSPPMAKDTMSPQRRSTDLMKTSVPLPFMLTIIGLVVAIAGGVWRIDARVSVIDAQLKAREQYEMQIQEANKRYLDQLSKT